MTTPHAAFKAIRTQAIPSLNLQIEEYQHITTAARHFHLAAKDDQNTFLVGFRTVPQDSTGVAHILEHTSLCGSRKYPVRDPFFMMIRRSLNTFMNAFTASDWTAYPFASRNRKDYFNLLDIYLDAAFFPHLNQLDFAQEGHRLEFATMDDPHSELTFKGVVFNEMKGAMSSPVSALWQSLTRELFPTITYHHNSGGDPAHIPDLSWEDLKQFHATHYHPSNAIFMTYGDIPAAELQQRFHDNALQQFQESRTPKSVPDEQRYSTPRQTEDRYAFDSEEPTSQKSHIVLGWLMGRCTSAEEVLEANLLSGILLDNSASPLRQVLETSDYGLAPSPLCGLSDSSREMFFACGLEGSEPEHAEAVERLILDTLQRLVDDGVESGMVESVLHQLELSQREISGDGLPYGLQLIVNILGGTMHGADPVALLDIDPILDSLRQKIADPDYVRGLIRQLIDNPHRVRLVMRPDKGLSGELESAEKQRLAAISAQLSESDRQQIVTQALKLAERQNEVEDVDILPKVGLEDIPASLDIPVGQRLTAGGYPATWFSRGTNGLVYEQLVIPLPELSERQRQLLPLLTDLLGELGSHGRSYLDTQALQAAVTGGIGASVSLRAEIDNQHGYRGFFTLSGKALKRNHSPLSELLQQTLLESRFDEFERIRELIAQERISQEQRVTGSGHALAMAAAASTLTPVTSQNHRWSGLLGIKALKALDKELDDRTALESLAAELQQLQQRLLQAPRELLLIAEEELHQEVVTELNSIWPTPFTPSNHSHLQLPQPSGRVAQGWTTSTQVNFCAKAYPTVPVEHDDSAALTVLAPFLRNNYLHRAIREQGGAYGGGASFDSDSGSFRFYSYRDPRLAESLSDFDRSIEWLLGKDHEWRLLEEAILGVISSIDKPGSPAGEARSSFHASLHGRTPEQRNRFRQRILEVRDADLKRVAATYLTPSNSHTAVITDSQRLQQSGLELEKIAL
ncbi:peptidase M16 [Ectothiorhodospiraceae bacterium BW-2]|nr:peptidase M16 [Ectothiorhodospiraceae bacterium BW-2]